MGETKKQPVNNYSADAVEESAKRKGKQEKAGVPVSVCDQGGPLGGGDLDLHEQEAAHDYPEQSAVDKGAESRARVPS